MSHRPRVAFLSTASGVAGAERQVHDLALGMRSRGWDVAAMSMMPVGATFEDLRDRGVPTFSLDMRRGIPDPRAVARLVSWLRTWKPDVLHAHMVHANLLARVSRVLARPPVLICTIHSQNQGARWRYVAYRLTDRLTNITTAVSHQARLDSIRMGATSESRIIVVPNGVDLSVFHADPAARERTRRDLGLADEFTWLAVGRMIEAKDFANLIDAFAQLDHGRQAIRLLIAGDGPLGADLRDRVRRRSLGTTVRFLGVRTDMADLMRSADAYVMSSAWEGLPLTLLEAAASALPIVATDVGGNREIVVDDVSGIIVPPRSSEALAGGMRTVLELSAADRSAMGLAGHDHVRSTFDLDVVVERWDALFREYLGRA